MVTTGPDPPNTEILNLNCPTFQCNKKDLPELRKTRNAVGGMIGGTPIICGGDGGDGTDYKPYNKCFKLTDKDWKELSSALAKLKRFSGAGSIVINDQLLVSGGIGSNGLTTQEFVPLDGQIMSSAIESPSKNGHCIIKVNQTSILVTGGFTKGNQDHVPDTWVQNFGTLKVEKGPSMAKGRMYHACGKVQIGGETILMVVGGRESYPGSYTKTTEYINLDGDAIWKDGPQLPFPLYLTTFIPSRNEQTAFLVGGKTGDGVVIDQTYRLVCDDSPDSCAWEETETKLKQPRSTGLVFPIPNSLAKDLCD